MNSIVWDCLIIACFFLQCRMFSPKPNWAITELSYHGGACHSSNVRERCSVSRSMCAPTTLPSGDDVVLTEITRHNSKNWMRVMQESFRTAISMARWFHRALAHNFNNTKFPGACDAFFLGSRNSFNKNLLSPRNNGFIVFFVFSIALILFFQLHSSSFAYMQRK